MDIKLGDKHQTHQTRVIGEDVPATSQSTFSIHGRGLDGLGGGLDGYPGKDGGKERKRKHTRITNY